MNEKLLKIQSELKAPKNQRNNFGNYNYRSCEDILEAVKPLLKVNGLTLTISDEIVEMAGRFYVKATCTLTDGEKVIEASAYAREAENKKGMDDSQITGSCSSYARKYALNGLFLIDDTKDADATNKHDKEPPKPATKDESEEIYNSMNNEGQKDNLCSKAQLDELKVKLGTLPFNKLMFEYQKEIPVEVYKQKMNEVA